MPAGSRSMASAVRASEAADVDQQKGAIRRLDVEETRGRCPRRRCRVWTDRGR